MDNLSDGHPITMELPLELLTDLAGPLPAGFLMMLRHRLDIFHHGEEFESLTIKQFWGHLDVIAWAWEAGQRYKGDFESELAAYRHSLARTRHFPSASS